MRRALILAALLIAPQAAFGACAPVAPAVSASDPCPLARRFDALIVADKFRDVAGNVIKWQMLIEDLKKDPSPRPALLARSYGWLACMVARL
jgi:hypothetical protein